MPLIHSLSSFLDFEYRQSSFIKVLEGNGWRPDDGSNNLVDAEQFKRIKAKSLSTVLVVKLNRNPFEYVGNNAISRKVLKEFKFPLVSIRILLQSTFFSFANFHPICIYFCLVH